MQGPFPASPFALACARLISDVPQPDHAPRTRLGVLGFFRPACPRDPVPPCLSQDSAPRSGPAHPATRGWDLSFPSAPGLLPSLFCAHRLTLCIFSFLLGCRFLEGRLCLCTLYSLDGSKMLPNRLSEHFLFALQRGGRVAAWLSVRERVPQGGEQTEACAGSRPLPGRGLAARNPRPSNAGLSPAAVQGNNEVSMWDMETGDRRLTLWASSAPPLSELQVRPASSPTPSVAQAALPAVILG